MQRLIRSPSPRSFPRCALAAGLLLFVALAGCSKQGDPLDAVRKQMAAEDYEGAVEPLRQLLAKDPDNPELNYLYGQALAVTQPNLAVWSLRKAMDDPEWLVPAGSQLAFLALAGLDFNEVIKITGRILEREPENTRVLMMRANAYAHSKLHPDLAIADAKHILEIDPDFSEAYEPLILGLLGQNKLEEARAALAEAGKVLVKRGGVEPRMAWHCATTATFDQESGGPERARVTWNKCVQEHPTDLDVVSNAMKFFDAQGEPDRSLEILKGALAGAPDSRIFRNEMAQRMYSAGDQVGAEALLLEATKSKDPNQAVGGWIDVGKFRQALGEYATAADALAQAVVVLDKAGSPSQQVLFDYADALVLAEQFDRALEVAKDLSVPAHQHLIRGRVAQERRDPAKALAEFSEALQLWPDNPWARYYAALAAEELGDFDRTLEELRDSVRVDPGATDARTRGASLLLARGNPSAALVMLQTAVEEKPLEIEGQLLGMRLSGLTGSTTGVADFFAMVEKSHPMRVGHALAAAADGLAQRNGPAMAVSMLAQAPRVDFNQPRFAPALRALARYSHEAGQNAETEAVFQKIFAAHPDSSAYQEIRALDLELSGAPKQEVQAAYAKALELDAENVQALAALGRLAASEDPAAALGYFDRAAAADPNDPALKLGAARALVASRKIAEAEQRLDALLLEHPYEAAAAAERARLDLEQGVATEQTLERARRAVRFGGGADALELLSQVLTKRNEPELAARAAEEARTLREAEAPKG